MTERMHAQRDGTNEESADSERWIPLQLNDNDELKVTTYKPTVVNTTLREVPGIVASAAYAAEDALGLVADIEVPEDGVLTNLLSIDTDDNAITFNALIFNEKPTVVADNAAFTLAAADFDKLVGVVTVDSFVAVAADTLGTENNIDLAYHAPLKRLWIQLVTTGTPNFAAGTSIWLKLGIRV